MNELQETQGAILKNPLAGEREAAPAAEVASADLQAGEKVFTIALFLAGLLFFIQSLIMWGKMSQPRIASAAALPLFVSGVWTVLSLVTVVENIRKTTPGSKAGSPGKAARIGFKFAFPTEVLAMLGFIVAYCVTLLLGMSFYIVTPLFLWGSMAYLMRKDYVKNILWTVLCMAFIILVFRMLFGVILP